MPTMIRQTPNPFTDLPGPALQSRYDGTSTSTPPPNGFQLPLDSQAQTQATTQVRQVQNTPQTVLRDYRHAARIFVDGNFRLSPKYNFLFYVEFDLNPLITNISNTTTQELGMIVKSVNLPKYTIGFKEHNAYNRKNYVQNNIKYDAVTISFHDDQSDTVRSFWYDYYSYYYRDPDYADATYTAPTKYNSRQTFDWGYTPRPAVGYNQSAANQPYQYIQAIRIYSLYQKNFSEYELINPIITSFKHGDHVNGEQGLMSHDMTVQFETVKYMTGYTTTGTVGGYIDLHYDNTPSPLTGSGGTQLIPDGMGGFSNAPSTITDLANNATDINPNLLSQQTLAAAAVLPSAAYAEAFGGAVVAMSGAGGTNNGGLSMPALGSLTQGLTSGAVLGAQLAAAGVGIAGSAATSLANGVTGGLAAGLGPNGKSILALGAAAIANPQAVIKTAENMVVSAATKAVTSAASAAVNTFVSQTITPYFKSIGQSISTTVSGAWADLTRPALPPPTIAADGTVSQALPNGNQISTIPNVDGTFTQITEDSNGNILSSTTLPADAVNPGIPAVDSGYVELSNQYLDTNLGVWAADTSSVPIETSLDISDISNSLS